MKCFHFTNGDRSGDGDGSGGDSDGFVDICAGRTSRVSWARSFSVASSTAGNSAEVRLSEFDSESRRNDLCGDSVAEFLALRRAANNDMRVFSFAELESATKGFNRSLLIGEGGFGSVYRGVVRVSDPAGGSEGGGDSEMEVAVKQLNRNGLQLFRDPNLVKLVGYCAEDDERGMQRLLVYALMKNKSLEDHLLGNKIQPPLPWMARLKIAQDAARGLAYLHEQMDFQLIFRDFKASNVLLDEDFNAKLSDFGLARLGPAEGSSHVSTSVVGTVGYAAPEYVQTGKLTVKSDVWSFGVVLYELITGRRAMDRNLPRSEQKLLDWVRPLVSDSKKFHLIVDPRLEGQYCSKSALKLAVVANKCLMKHTKSRPKMSQVVEMLGEIINEETAFLQTDAAAASPNVYEDSEEKEDESGKETEPMKQGRHYLRRKVLDIKEMVNLKSKSVGKLDLMNWTPGLVRTR